MKIRNGFVSNSSSSSFIINIGIVKNEEKFNKFLNKHKIKQGWEFIMMNMAEYLENDDSYPVWSECDWAGYYGGKYSIDEIFKEDPNATVFVKIGTGPSDDSHFWNGYDYDYDVDLSEFDEVDQNIGNVDNGVMLVETHFGAGRDG